VSSAHSRYGTLSGAGRGSSAGTASSYRPYESRTAYPLVQNPEITTGATTYAMSEPVPYPEPDADWLDNINLDATPPEFKKVGSDWFALWNPELKRQLDVNLVHTLHHDT
jgi:glucose repression regulatory protein TUP1